ncbi:hypothetical protein [Streptomyces sp. GMR22]|uniref:hypothetical protein n=1 Tax=Streptomyces sp. GMR22 TaxID=2759524 RepID=UPI0015FE27D0|nr:hypothetical protein [Streptomyces sp. GMR22]MBA6434318.1 hypothetical protein [Streptomyces sp. GMR22]
MADAARTASATAVSGATASTSPAGSTTAAQPPYSRASSRVVPRTAPSSSAAAVSRG